ncbi:MAG: hypothetical protein H0X62_06300, partial [Bacteroidetes bacterium]|nr:hypothetical protein [Bacteroidota bacterium]
MRKIYLSFAFLAMASVTVTAGEKEKTEKEAKELRTQNTKHFEKPDGKMSALISGGSLHYKDNQGKWQDINTEITASTKPGFLYENTTNNLKSYFPSSLSSGNGIKVVSDDGEITIGASPEILWIDKNQKIFSIEKGNNTEALLTNNNISFTCFSHGNYEFITEADRIKNNLILNHLPSAVAGKSGYLGLSEIIRLPAGYTIHSNGKAIRSETTVNTALIVKNQFGKEVFVIPLPEAYEQADQSQSIYADGNWNTTYRIIPANNGFQLITLVPLDWLNAPSRNFPVVIDPIITIPGNFGGWQNGSGSVEGNPTTFVFTGLSGQNYRSWIRFDISAIPNLATILNVEVELLMNGTSNANTTETIEINAVSGIYGPYGGINLAAYADFATGLYTTFQATAIQTYPFISLGANANSDLQSKLPSNQFQIAMSIVSPSTWKRFTSNLSTLRVDYSLCNQASTPLVNSNNGTSVCSGASTILSATGNLNDATHWQWYTSSCGGTPIGQGDSIVVNPTTATTYYVRGESTTCTSTTCGSISLTILPSYNIPQSITICGGDSVLLDGNYQKNAGTYADQYATTSGCDSIITTTLNVLPSYHWNETVTMCPGDSIMLAGSYQKTAGIYTDYYYTTDNCDSIKVTEVDLYPTYSFFDYAFICDGDSILIGGVYRKNFGVYEEPYATVNGCDSIYTIELLLNPKYLINIPVVICMGDSVLAGGAYQKT